jgi:uncharacterized protein YbaR (Trm112 family)
MHPELPQLLALICPACRRISERGRELWTVSLAEVFAREGDGEGAEVLEGILGCANPECGRRYPILDGIPVLVADPGQLVCAQPAALLSPLHPELLALLASGSTDDAPLARLIEHLSIYLDAHWGDCAQPGPDGPVPGWGGAALFQAVAARSSRPVRCALELGCSVGRGVASLCAGAELAVGVDMHLFALRIARRLLKGVAEPVAYARRIIGRHYQTARLIPAGTGKAAPRGMAAFVCGDALDPPFSPQSFERVVALNLLDSVRSPPQLLSVVDGLCMPAGEVLLASPYSWQSGIVEESGRIGGAEPVSALHHILTKGAGLSAAYEIEQEQELPWHLRRDARSVSTYLVHTLLARKHG